MVGGMFIFWHWEAMLISYLSSRVIELPFKTMPELLAETDYKVIITVGTSLEDFFKHSRDPVIQDVWSNRIQPHLDDPGWRLYQMTEKMSILMKGHNLAMFGNGFTGKQVQ